MKINFVNTIEPFIRKSPKAIEVGDGFKFVLEDAKLGRDIYTKGINSCFAVLFNAGNTNKLAHIDPKSFNIRKFQEMFRNMAEDFRQKYGQTRAVVYGGWEMNRIDPKVKTLSFDAYNTAATVLDDINLPLVQINGKRLGVNEYDNIFASGENVFLANKNYEKLGITNTKNLSVSELTDKLETLYEYVDFDPRALT